MADLRIRTTGSADRVFDEAAVQLLKSSIRGPLYRLGDAGYEAARKIYNGMIDRHPALIVRCLGVADVIAAVNFAREHDLLLAVRGGGHSAPGLSMCNGGLVVDLSAMKSVRVDPVRRTARAEGGATWADFDHETGLCPGHHGRYRLDHGDRWTHARRRHRLSQSQVRSSLRQPDLG